ncbi:MAG: hypothetical protein Q8P64_01750 [Deltaproteobacteria bacterium]|nr:hypothetical protein [Deltaproteobacteria bacterium]
MAYLGRRILDDMVKEIASHFNRSHVTIGEAIIKVKILLQKDKSFNKVRTPMGRKKYRIFVA